MLVSASVTSTSGQVDLFLHTCFRRSMVKSDRTLWHRGENVKTTLFDANHELNEPRKKRRRSIESDGG